MYTASESMNDWAKPDQPSSTYAPVKTQINGHHKHAYRALLESLSERTDAFGRRQQLDKWLMQHGYNISQGQQWESTSSRAPFSWKDEYALVVRQSLENGYFYSSAFQQQLFQYYIVTGRLTVTAVESIHNAVIQQHNTEKVESGIDWTTRIWAGKVKRLLSLH